MKNTQIKTLPTQIQIPNCAWHKQSGLIITTNTTFPKIVGFHYEQLDTPEPQYELNIIDIYTQIQLQFHIINNILVRNQYFFIQIPYLTKNIQNFLIQQKSTKITIPAQFLLHEIKYIDYIAFLDIIL